MARDDGILDLDALYGRSVRERKYLSTANVKYNPKMIVYYNSDDVVMKTEEILYPGTVNEITYSQTYWYSDIGPGASGIDHWTIIDPWETVVEE